MIELSSEARTAYEAMVSSLEQQDQTEQETNTEELQSNSLYEEAKPGPDPTEPEEPEYSKLVFCQRSSALDGCICSSYELI